MTWYRPSMDKSAVIAALRAHESELRHVGIDLI
jgi:hypothetical protein